MLTLSQAGRRSPFKDFYEVFRVLSVTDTAMVDVAGTGVYAQSYSGPGRCEAPESPTVSYDHAYLCKSRTLVCSYDTWLGEAVEGQTVWDLPGALGLASA